jgi:uncharacterized protein (DUF1697 family)
MQKYLVLLRGINVGGNNIIKMADLKSCLERAGFEHVKTYIQSGNVILESKETDVEKLTTKIELLLSKQFNYQSKVVVRTHAQLQSIIKNAPEWWGKDAGYKHNLLFIKEPMTAKQALQECGTPKPNIELAEAGEGAIYLSASAKDLLNTNFVKLAAKPIYQHMTIRNYNTSMKLLELMNK